MVDFVDGHGGVDHLRLDRLFVNDGLNSFVNVLDVVSKILFCVVECGEHTWCTCSPPTTGASDWL
jgi:hypothetical protein